MLLTARQLARDNAALCEEVKQLKAAVNVYRELAMMRCRAEHEGSFLGKVRIVRSKADDIRRSSVA
ncbi:MAG TPA: hypothetical protein VIN93_14370 [Bryobacteraceae bacterium]|jgi:hypothetical protein